MTQYSGIAKPYDSISNLSFRKYCESWTFKQLLGDISGQHVLDVACGAGFVTEIVSELSPAHICAIDIEKTMIEQAKAKKYAIDGVEFICSDINALEYCEKYDVAVGAFSLNEVKNKSALARYVNSIYKYLKGGGTAIFEFDNALEASKLDWSNMGYPTYEIVSSPEDCVRYKIGIQSPEGLFELECTYHSVEELKLAFEKAGFKDIEFHDIEISKEGFQQMGDDYWASLLSVPLTKFIKAKK